MADSESVDLNCYTQFDEKSIRLGFVRKVYAILVCQLAVTIGVIAIFLYVEPVREYTHRNQWVWIVCFVATFALIIALACCGNLRRTFPTNMILLGLFTAFESVLLGSVASYYSKWEVMVAVGITAVVALSLTIFALQTKWDFTMMGGILMVSLVVLMCFGLLCIIVRNYYLNLALSALGALLFGFYLVFDTQMMLGGKHKYALSPEEYVFAALNLYLDIINMFLCILSLVGSSR